MLRLHLGTYEKSGGPGLVPLGVAPDGTITADAPFAQAPNASFGAPGDGLVYLVDERDEGAVTILRSRGKGWERLARVASAGGAPCHLAVDSGRRRLAVANYASGSVALFELGARGVPDGPPALFHGSGSGPVADRQEGPHAHCVRFSADGKRLYWTDLGADRIACLTLDPAPAGAQATAWHAPPGSGPRHLLFDSSHRLALVLCELASTLTLLRVGDDRLEPLQTVSTVPAGFDGDSLGGHLELGAAGTRVYVSNRGHDSIAVFALENERLERIQHVPSGGTHPRHFALLEQERLLAAAHEKDGRVTLFAIAPDGTLSPRGDGITVPGACFLLA
jgi:6-phosphogluconolactonase